MIKQELIELLKTELKNNNDRLTHSIAVSKKALELAEIYKCVSEDLELCALFHDVCKYYTKQDYLLLMSEKEYNKISKKNKILLHGYGASLYLKKLGISDSNLLNAVRYHTVGHSTFNTPAKILFLADKIDDTRHYPEVDYIRQTSVVNLDYAILLYFGFNNKLLKEKNKSVHKLSTKFIKKLSKGVTDD